MGSFQSSCQQCTNLGPSGTAVISFSEDLLNRLTDGRIDELKLQKKQQEGSVECPQTKYPPIKLTKCVDLLTQPDDEDRKIFESLDCMDKEQTKKYDLTYEYVDKMTTQLLERVHVLQFHMECPGKEIIIDCYKKKPDNILECDKTILKYLDCIDMSRWNELKKYMKCDIKGLFLNSATGKPCKPC